VDAACEYGVQLAKLREELSDRLEIVMRVYFEKPRTNIGWKGLINDPHLDDSYDINTGCDWLANCCWIWPIRGCPPRRNCSTPSPPSTLLT
jgi:phospho-2-dehydro-3-deoxyheptonate aldolase